MNDKNEQSTPRTDREDRNKERIDRYQGKQDLFWKLQTPLRSPNSYGSFGQYISSEGGSSESLYEWDIAERMLLQPETFFKSSECLKEAKREIKNLGKREQNFNKNNNQCWDNISNNINTNISTLRDGDVLPFVSSHADLTPFYTTHINSPVYCPKCSNSFYIDKMKYQCDFCNNFFFY